MRCRLLLLIVVVLVPMSVQAQAPPMGPDRPIDAAGRNAVIDGVLAKLNEHYVFPDVAKKMEAAIRERQEQKEYDAVASSRDFAVLLTKHLREVCKDKHLGVRYSSEALPALFAPPTSETDRQRQKRQLELRNYGFKKVERLGGGVGLLELENFHSAELIGETAAAAMGFLALSDAIIVDLRKNGGGDPAAVILLCSYFFERQTHLNSISHRSAGTTRDYWTFPAVPGKKLIGKDLFVLTSHYTFSGAEEFAYNLQSQKRATIVGETTGGGAHPVRGFRINDHFSVGVPFARSINPVTKTNWEGTGVKPDVEVNAAQALDFALRMALRKTLSRLEMQNPKPEVSELTDLRRLIAELDAKLEKTSTGGSRP